MTGVVNGQRAKVPLSRPPAEVWERPAMRAALGCQDIGAVYRLLQAEGYSQQVIATWTGQGQSEVSAIIHGRRVISYQVLSSIAEGLGIPRGYLGLSRCPYPAHDHRQADAEAAMPGAQQDSASGLKGPEAGR